MPDVKGLFPIHSRCAGVNDPAHAARLFVKKPAIGA
jgi:hypothetical protein